MTNVRDLPKWVKSASKKDLRKLSGHSGHSARILRGLPLMIMVSSAQVISVTGVNQKIADP